MLKYLLKHVERAGDAKRKKVTLTREQVLASVTFCAMVMTAWREERDGVPLSERTCHQMILLGQGGTGKTMIVIEIFIPLVKWAFPPDAEGDRWLVLAFSHAQADAISNGTVRARTLHSACAMRVQSMANSKMAPKERIDALTSTWANKVFLVNEEVSMMPAEAINMEMFRAAHGRRVKFQLNMDNYARTQELFGRMPLTLFLGDFLQLKPPKQLSLVDDLVQKARDGKSVSVEAQAAVDAFRDIDVVIELLSHSVSKTSISRSSCTSSAMRMARSPCQTGCGRASWTGPWSGLARRSSMTSSSLPDTSLASSGMWWPASSWNAVSATPASSMCL
jgi:hypothetical protein